MTNFFAILGVCVFLVAIASHAQPAHSSGDSAGGMAMGQHGHGEAPSEYKQPIAILDIPESREGSGTSWLPDETPMYAIHSMLGPWNLMFHGNLFGQYINEGGTRGESQIGSVNWLMAMGRRQLGRGELGLRAMFSAEPWTVGKCGYPDLLASGEVCNGAPLHDRQHPHDVFMELAGFYRHEISERIGIELYGGPSAEPALGPTAFPHRISSIPNPMAPITHHWFDSTHISFGVVTAGVFSRVWKIEGSIFNGREPDENRTNIDLAPLDSYSGRIQFLPNRRWSLQISAGHLNEAEEEVGTGGRIDADRYTASAIYHHSLTDNGTWATSFGYGRNVEEGHATNALFLESSYNIANQHIFTGRAEWVEKTAHDLDLSFGPSEDETFSVGKIDAGYTYQFRPIAGLTPGIGGGLMLSILPEDLKPDYGERLPLGYLIFVSLRPGPMEAMTGHPMGN